MSISFHHFLPLLLGLAACAEPVFDDSLSDEQSAQLSSPKALSQCPANAVCAWSQADFQGNFSFWSASDTGCKNHANNPNIRSGFNRTGFNVRFGGGPTLSPGTGFSLIQGNPIIGLICWPV